MEAKTLDRNTPTFKARASGTGSIGSIVWIDYNKDGIQDNGEPGVPNITVNLYLCADGSSVATTTTDTQGNYLFENVGEDNYYIKFSGIPTGYKFIQSNNVVDIEGSTLCFAMSEGQNKLDVNAPIYYEYDPFKQVTVQQECCISYDKPDISTIVGQSVSVEIVSTDLISTPIGVSCEGQVLTGLKLNVCGNICVDIQYICNQCGSQVTDDRCILSFCEFIVVPLDSINNQFEVETDIEDIYQQVTNCRCYYTSVTMLLSAYIH